MRALVIEGTVIGLFVILNGLYIALVPPVGDEPQGYAIMAIGFFIVLVTAYFGEQGCGTDDGPRG